MEVKTVFVNIDAPGIDEIDIYMAHGGYEALKRSLLEMPPDDVTSTVARSGLRGRGGRDEQPANLLRPAGR